MVLFTALISSSDKLETSSKELSKRQQHIALALFADPQDLDTGIATTIQLLRNDVLTIFFGGEDYNAIFDTNPSLEVVVEGRPSGWWHVTSHGYEQPLLRSFWYLFCSVTASLKL